MVIQSALHKRKYNLKLSKYSYLLIHSILYCTFYLIAHFTHLIFVFVPICILFLPIFIYILLCYASLFFFFCLYCPLSGPVLTYISLQIIPCMIVYVTNNKEPFENPLK